MDNKRQNLYIMGALAVLVVIVFIWRVFSVQGLEKKMIQQRVSITEKSQQLLAENTRGMLRLTTVPLVWAVRKEMISENYGQINEYLSSFVRERNIQQIVLVKADGTIVVATDKKLEGSRATSVFPQHLFEQNDVTITDDKSGDLQVAAPIMGLNARLGTLILIYRPEKISFEPKT